MPHDPTIRTSDKPIGLGEWLLKLRERAAAGASLSDVPSLESIDAAAAMADTPEKIDNQAFYAAALLFGRVVGGEARQLKAEQKTFSHNYRTDLSRGRSVLDRVNPPQNDFELFRRYPVVSASARDALNFATAVFAHIKETYEKEGSPFDLHIAQTLASVISSLESREWDNPKFANQNRKDLLTIENKLSAIFYILESADIATTLADLENVFKLFQKFASPEEVDTLSLYIERAHKMIDTAAPDLGIRAFLLEIFHYIYPIILDGMHASKPVNPAERSAPTEDETQFRTPDKSVSFRQLANLQRPPNLAELTELVTQTRSAISAINYLRLLASADPTERAVALLLGAYRLRLGNGFIFNEFYAPEIRRALITSRARGLELDGDEVVRDAFIDPKFERLYQTGSWASIPMILDLSEGDEPWGPELAAEERAFDVFTVGRRIPVHGPRPYNYFPLAARHEEFALFVSPNALAEVAIITTDNWNDARFRLAVFSALLMVQTGGRISIYQNAETVSSDERFATFLHRTLGHVIKNEEFSLGDQGERSAPPSLRLGRTTEIRHTTVTVKSLLGEPPHQPNPKGPKGDARASHSVIIAPPPPIRGGRGPGGFNPAAIQTAAQRAMLARPAPPVRIVMPVMPRIK